MYMNDLDEPTVSMIIKVQDYITEIISTHFSQSIVEFTVFKFIVRQFPSAALGRRLAERIWGVVGVVGIVATGF